MDTRSNTISALQEEIEELKAKLEWNIHEVARYSVAIEEEYVLKAEFEKLKKEIDELKEKNDKLVEEHQEQIATIHDLEKENEELKDSLSTAIGEIEELKEEVEERTTYSVLPEEGKFMDENEKLKKEIDELNEKITCLESDSHNEVSQAEFDELKEENEKLKAENEKLNFQVDALDKQATDFCLQKGKLKEENEELKKEEAELLWMRRYERDFRKGLYKDEDFMSACEEETLDDYIDGARDEYEETMVLHNTNKNCGFPSIEDDRYHSDVGVLYNNLMDIAEDARRLIEWCQDPGR